MAQIFLFPGLSDGTPQDSIEAMADWIIALLDSLDVNAACLVGRYKVALSRLMQLRYPTALHELGSLPALYTSVNDHLLSLSDKALSKAIQAMISWGHGPMGHA